MCEHAPLPPPRRKHRASASSPYVRRRILADLPGLAPELARGLDPLTLVLLAARWLDTDDRLLAREREARFHAQNPQISQNPQAAR